VTPPLASTAAKSITGAVSATPEVKKLKQVAQQFEAVFLRQMIGSMRSASLGDGIFDSSATQQFRDMGDSKLADQMAGHGALHIADLLVKQLGAKLHGSLSSPAQAGVQSDVGGATPASAGVEANTGSDDK